MIYCNQKHRSFRLSIASQENSFSVDFVCHSPVNVFYCYHYTTSITFIIGFIAFHMKFTHIYVSISFALLPSPQFADHCNHATKLTSNILLS